MRPSAKFTTGWASVRTLIVFLMLTLGTLSGYAQDVDTASVSIDETQAAQEAADAWLALIDSLDYAASWQQAAPLFQQQVSEAQWVQALESVRGPLGPLLSRALDDRNYTTALPNAPEGEYVIIIYNSAYTQLEEAVETVTMVKTKAGEWRAVGYYVRPAQ